MYPRLLQKKLKDAFKKYPITTVTGPRQSGKSTLIRGTFPSLPYANLESSRDREFAINDPIGFLGQFPDGAIIDEVQKVADLLSDLQVIVDERSKNGQFIISGSENLTLSNSVSQSLAGRTLILRLLPLSIKESDPFPLAISKVNEHIYTGFYPRIFSEELNPTEAYSAYIESYIEKDVRNLLAIKDLAKFRKFMQLAAGRIGQVLNKDNIANDVGVSPVTVENWLSILESTFVCYRLQPWFSNMKKRLVKSPKLYFYDVGIASALIGITDASQLGTHPLRGALFENLQVMEVMKYLYCNNLQNKIYFYRDSHQNEVDLLVQNGQKIIPIEIKSSETFHQNFLKGIKSLQKTSLDLEVPAVVLGSRESQSRSDYQILSWDGLASYIDKLIRFC
jgi:uncharacterized protein